MDPWKSTASGSHVVERPDEGAEVAGSADEREETRESIADEPSGYRIALDTEGSTIRKWGLSEKGEEHSVPAALPIDQNSLIRFATVGDRMSDRADPDELPGVIDRIR